MYEVERKSISRRITNEKRRIGGISAPAPRQLNAVSLPLSKRGKEGREEGRQVERKKETVTRRERIKADETLTDTPIPRSAV